MSNGWIKLHRRLLDNPRATDPEWLSVWIYLLLNATHQPRKMNFDGKIVELQPGQLITGRFAIAENTGVNESKVKRILQTLKTDQQIDQQAGVKGSMITVRNWQAYQDADQQIDQRLTSKRPATDQRLTTNKKERMEEGKEGKKQNLPPCSESGKFFDAFGSVFRELFGNDYTHQKADFVQLANWRKSQPAITVEQFAETCRQVMPSKFSPARFLTLRGICSDWSSATALLKRTNGHQPPTTGEDHEKGF